MVVVCCGIGGGGGYSAGNSFALVSSVTRAVAVVLMATTESITIYFCGVFFRALATWPIRLNWQLKIRPA